MVAWNYLTAEIPVQTAPADPGEMNPEPGMALCLSGGGIEPRCSTWVPCGDCMRQACCAG